MKKQTNEDEKLIKESRRLGKAAAFYKNISNREGYKTVQSDFVHLYLTNTDEATREIMFKARQNAYREERYRCKNYEKELISESRRLGVLAAFYAKEHDDKGQEKAQSEFINLCRTVSNPTLQALMIKARSEGYEAERKG